MSPANDKQGKIYKPVKRAVPKKQKAEPKPETIVLVCPRNDKASASVSDPFLLPMIGQLGDVLAKHNCELLIAAFDTDGVDWKARFIDSGKAQGIIVFGHGTFPKSIGHLAANHVPFVVWGATHKHCEYCTVGSDNEKGGYLATSHLLDAGRRRIVFLGNYELPEIKERYEGYLRALKEFSIKRDSALVVKSHPQSYSTFDSLYHKLVERNVEFDAIFASTDTIALDAIAILKKLDLSVPEDISVVGFDDIPHAAISNPPLTTVAQDINFAAREIIVRLFSLMQQKHVKSLRLPVKFIERESSITECCAKGILTLSARHTIEYADKTTEALLGYKLCELVGKDLNYLLPDPALYGERVEEFDWDSFADKQNRGVARFIRLEHKNGELLPLEIMVSRREAKRQGVLTCLLWSSQYTNDMGTSEEAYQLSVEQAVAERTEELKSTALRMEKLAFEDALTGLANRRHFDEALKRALALAIHDGYYLSLAMFDVDFFKSYNDNYGHPEGDACLRTVADVLKAQLQKGKYLVARYGGEEFAVIMPHVSPKDVLLEVKKTLRAICEESIIHEYSLADDCVTLSCGLYSCIPTQEMNAAKLIWFADKELYKAKGSGRNRVIQRVKE